MRYSLLSRFQGTLLTAALGDELGAYGRSRQAVPQNSMNASKQTGLASARLAGWHPGLASESSLADSPPFGGRAAVSCACALVETGGWHERGLAAIGVPFAASGAETGVKARSFAAEMTIATLPIVLFFHDDKIRQQQRLLQIVELWHCPPGTEAGLLAVGYAIAQVLQERLEPRTLLPQTIAYLKQMTANPATPLLELVDTLEQAQILVQQGAGLHDAIVRLTKEDYTGNGAIALTFYCFLTTPEDLRLSLLRAARCGELASVVCALTGALNGAHHGISGLPLTWQLTDTLPLSWGLTAGAMRQLAAHLFAAWSGVYAPKMPMDVATIAAPGVIRPR